MKKILLMAGAALYLTGCGEKGDFEKAINAKIGQSKTCFSLRTTMSHSLSSSPNRDLMKQGLEQVL